MLIIFDDKHKKHLNILSTFSEDVLQEFARISLEFIRKGTNAKIYQSAAQKLEIDSEQVKNAVEGLIYLFVESSKSMVNDTDFQDSLLPLGFTEEKQKCLLNIYSTHKTEIRNILTDLSLSLPQYNKLEWRFEIELASRTLRHQVQPTVILKLHLDKHGKKETKTFQTDPTNLIHLTSTLEDALQEMKTAHVRRILRNI